MLRFLTLAQEIGGNDRARETIVIHTDYIIDNIISTLHQSLPCLYRSSIGIIIITIRARHGLEISKITVRKTGHKHHLLRLHRRQAIVHELERTNGRHARAPAVTRVTLYRSFIERQSTAKTSSSSITTSPGHAAVPPPPPPPPCTPPATQRRGQRASVAAEKARREKRDRIFHANDPALSAVFWQE